MIIKVSSKGADLPLRPIRISSPGWAGDPVKMEDGAPIQPLHCLPFVEGSTYGLELLYPHETECRVINDDGSPRFHWDFMKEPGDPLDGGEFLFFSPVHKTRYYLFNTRLDIEPPPGYVIRTEPHPRFFTDDTGTVPLPMIGHLQNEWYARQLFVVFRVPREGQRHIFRKNEPYAQLLFVPQQMKYEITTMTPEEEAVRVAMRKGIQSARGSIATKHWYNSTNNEQDNHYKVLAAAFSRGGGAEVERLVKEGVERQKQGLPNEKSIEECMAMANQHMQSGHFMEAADLFTHIQTRDPRNAEAMSNLGVCCAVMGKVPLGIQMMTQAVALQPNSPKLHRDLGELLRRNGRLVEAEASFRASLKLSPNNPDLLSLLGMVQAQRGDLAGAVNSCQTAVAVATNTPAAQRLIPAAHFRLGFILTRLGKNEEARASFDAGLAHNPQFDGAKCLGIRQAEMETMLKK